MSGIDVVIPVYKPGKKLEKLLEALKSQTVKPGKIIVMHTGDILDGEPDYSGEPIELHLIGKEAFDHGGTRNLGAGFSQADILVFMTQDAVPADDYLLEKLAAALGAGRTGTKAGCGGAEEGGGHRNPDGNSVCVAYARQLPWEDCKPVERYIREFNYPQHSEARTRQDIPVRGIKAFCNSNVCSAYRREVFDRLGGFEEQTIFNEDMLFAAKAIQQGYGVVYAGAAEVFHSHNLGLSDQFHRNFDNGVSQAEHPEVFSAVSSEKEGMKLARYCVSRMKADRKLYLLPYFILNCCFRYAGFFLGKRYRRIPKGLVKACSLNKRYWERKRETR